MEDRPAVSSLGRTILYLALLSACFSDTSPGTMSVERTVRGDTVVVRTMSGSAWDTTPVLVEEIRIGKLEGAEEEMFAVVSDLVPDGNGGVYVFDGRVPALRHYDSDGSYTATIGGEGAGPGEYRDGFLALHIRPDGRLLMHDPRNARINVYAPDGVPIDHWPVASGLFTSNAMVVDTAGHVYLKILVGRPQANRPPPIGLLHLDSQGQLVDTIPPPTISGEPETAEGVFGVAKVWELSPSGDIVVGVNSSYSFEVRRMDGSVVRIEKAQEPVPVNSEEHAEWEARNEWTRRYRAQYQTAEIPPVPHIKPAYRRFDIGGEGQIWVRVYAESEKFQPSDPSPMPDGTPPPPIVSWREPVVYDVFEPDGTFLGSVRMPERVSLAAHNGTEVWGILRGDLDEQYVLRYRLEVDIQP